VVVLKLLFILIFSSPYLFASGEGRLLYTEDEWQETLELASNQTLAQKAGQKLSEESVRRLRFSLKLAAKSERDLIERQLKNDPWKAMEKRENYYALQNWLQRISPITKPAKKPRRSK